MKLFKSALAVALLGAFFISPRLVLAGTGGPTGGGGGGGPCTGCLINTNNLSDVSSVAAAQTNLGIGSAGLVALPVVGTPGSFSPLEQWPSAHALPTAAGPTTLTCTGTAGTYPYNDVYWGTLSGASVTYALPTSGCSDQSIITIHAVQDAAHTITVQTSAAGGILGSATFPIGASAGNRVLLQYLWDNVNAAWFLVSDVVNPPQPWPQGAGGTGTASITNHAVQVGGASAFQQVGPSASTHFPLTSGGASANPGFELLPFAGGGTNTTTPLPTRTVFCTFGTNSGACTCSSGACTFTPDSGTTSFDIYLAGGAGGGGGAQTGGAAAHSGGGGVGAAAMDILVQTVVESSYTVTLGAGGSAGVCNSGAANVGGLSTSSSLTGTNWTNTIAVMGAAGTAAQGGTTTTDGAAGTANSLGTAGFSAAGFHGADVRMTYGNNGSTGSSGAGGTPGVGSFRQGLGGVGAETTSGGACNLAATAGSNGYARILEYGIF